nr:MAG TPA: hypothetical protein [Caudoviricetes sp.]
MRSHISRLPVPLSKPNITDVKAVAMRHISERLMVTVLVS